MSPQLSRRLKQWRCRNATLNASWYGESGVWFFFLYWVKMAVFLLIDS